MIFLRILKLKKKVNKNKKEGESETNIWWQGWNKSNVNVYENQCI